jgi:hypothetical protein
MKTKPKLILKKLYEKVKLPRKCRGNATNLPKVKTLKHIAITDYSGINLVRKWSNMPEIKNTCEIVEFKKNLGSFRAEGRCVIFTNYLVEKAVNSIVNVSISNMANDLNGTEKQIRVLRDKAVEYGALTKDGNKLIVNSRKLSEWRRANE